jgi:hypothetical protein
MRALEFGVLHVDYRTLGDNIWTQRWVSSLLFFRSRRHVNGSPTNTLGRYRKGSSSFRGYRINP